MPNLLDDKSPSAKPITRHMCVWDAIKQGHGVNVQDYVGNTALILVAGHNTSNNAHRIESLLGQGADVSICNDEGVTALHECLASGRFEAECISLLLDAGADINVQDSLGNTPLFVGAKACLKSRYENFSKELSLLIDRGADLLLANKAGHSAADVIVRSDPSYFNTNLITLAKSALERQYISSRLPQSGGKETPRKAKL